MKTSARVEFEVHVAGLPGPVLVRIDDFGERCLAAVDCGVSRSRGIGGSAREALVAALAPLGSRAAATVMASPTMFGASLQVVAARVASV